LLFSEREFSRKRLAHVVDCLDPVVEGAAEIVCLCWALRQVLLHKQVVLLVRGQCDLYLCSVQGARSCVWCQRHLAFHFGVVEVADVALHEELKTPLLLHVEPVLLQQQTREYRLARLDQSVFKLWQCRVDCALHASLSQLHWLGLSNGASDSNPAHIAVEVNALEEWVVAQSLHAARLGRTQSLGRVQHDKLVDQIAAGRLDLHRGGPLNFPIVDLGEHRVVLCARKRHLSGHHLENDAAQAPQIS